MKAALSALAFYARVFFIAFPIALRFYVEELIETKRAKRDAARAALSVAGRQGSREGRA